MTFAEKVIRFYQSLDLSVPLPEGVLAMNPFQDEVAMTLCDSFYKKFFNDHLQRTMIIGINPGRHGGGITGVPFTDPVKLEQLGIPNPLKKKTELSADFIYRMIEHFGGAERFYARSFVSAMSPLGFTKDGKNLNYYDIKELLAAVEPFMIRCIKTQLDFGISREVCFCLGEGKNFSYLVKLNGRFGFFKDIIPLAHPRFIMQYRRKYLDVYVEGYIRNLNSALSGASK
ncbi:MAG TPA: uracil-DNA glycosylase family protein [Ohtaekwangia sp.]|nr:uracil-DNA glycosylase family protein [Ohtaekwangia sp.]